MAVNNRPWIPAGVEVISRCGYPQPYRTRHARHKRRLGMRSAHPHRINLTMLPARQGISMRHWQYHEDEFVYVLEVGGMLRTDSGEQRLTAGMCAGFPAGSPDGHQIINRGNAAGAVP